MKRGKGSPGRNLLFVSLPGSLVLAAFTYAVSRSLPAASAVGGITFLASAWSNARFSVEVRRREESLADARAVEVTEVQAFRVLDIEHLGSHGPALVFFAGEGKALLLVGQWLLQHHSFPSAFFRLYRWTDTKKPIRIESMGTRIEPEHSTVRLRPDYRLTDVEVIAATPETLQHDLDIAFGKKEPNQTLEPTAPSGRGSS